MNAINIEEREARMARKKSKLSIEKLENSIHSAVSCSMFVGKLTPNDFLDPAEKKEMERQRALENSGDSENCNIRSKYVSSCGRRHSGAVDQDRRKDGLMESAHLNENNQDERKIERHGSSKHVRMSSAHSSVSSGRRGAIASGYRNGSISSNGDTQAPNRWWEEKDGDLEGRVERDIRGRYVGRRPRSRRELKEACYK